MSLKTITLTLARDPEAPEGREDCGHEIVAPLSKDATSTLRGGASIGLNAGTGGFGPADHEPRSRQATIRRQGFALVLGLIADLRAPPPKPA